ncbi:MAG: hypothetical protein HN348_10435 [Proteobacteria bacterium]|nr:hypothetical protein [Pseudomonadota bacterium]
MGTLVGLVDEVLVGGESLPPIPLGETVERLLVVLGDLAVRATVEADGRLLVQYGPGFEVRLADGAMVTIKGACRGTPSTLRLCRPLEVHCRGDGLSISHKQLKRLAKLAKVRIEKATLHPDGSVRLEGGAIAPLRGAVRGGLHTTARQLSRLVRRTPAIKRFLYS